MTPQLFFTKAQFNSRIVRFATKKHHRYHNLPVISQLSLSLVQAKSDVISEMIKRNYVSDDIFRPRGIKTRKIYFGAPRARL